jgi:hypothetical protein
MVTLRTISLAAVSKRDLGRCLLGVGLLLLALNLCGLQNSSGGRGTRLGRQAIAQAIDMADPDAADGPAALRASIAALRSGASFDLASATHLVHGATTHSDERRVGLTENWVQWLAGQFYHPLAKTQSTHRLIAGRLANCSERSQILKTMAEAAGAPCRFIGLHGHVVLEVCQAGMWHVADPGYDLVYSLDIDQLQRPEAAAQIRDRLHTAGHPEEVIENYVAIVQSAGDNVVLPVGSPLSPRLYRAEAACVWIAWLMPLVSLLAGLRLSTPKIGDPQATAA